MLIHAPKHMNSGDKQRAIRLLALPRQGKQDSELHWLRAQIDACGSIEYARAVAHALSGAALHECERVFANLRPSRDLEFIRALPYWVLERT